MDGAIIRQPSKINRTYIGPGILSLITVALLAILLGLTIHWSQLRGRAFEGREQEVCVQCGTLSEPYTGTNHTGMCCEKTSVLLKDLIGKFSQQKFSERETARMLSNYGNGTCSEYWIPVAVKLFGIDRGAQLKEEQNVVHFKDDPDVKEAHFEHRDGVLLVKKPSFYYIYSQIKINYTPGDNDIVFNHWIHHYSPDGTDRKILESSKSSCESVSNQDEVTLMHGAVFELNEGDKLMAKTSHPNDLSTTDSGHFFGMYSISSSSSSE